MFNELKLTCSKCGNDYIPKEPTLYYHKKTDGYGVVVECDECRAAEVNGYTIRDAVFTKTKLGIVQEFATVTFNTGEVVKVEFYADKDKMTIKGSDYPAMVTEQLFKLYKAK